MVKLRPVALFILNQVKFKRLIKGLSVTDLSIYLGVSEAYINAIESRTNTSQYTYKDLIKIIEILDCNITDFYPPEQLLLKHDGEHVFKEIISLSKEEDTLSIIKGLIERKYFQNKISLLTLVKYLNIKSKSQEAVVLNVLNKLVEEKDLNFSEGFYTSK